MKIFIISDTHFSHKNIIEYTGRPFKTVEEMNEAIINKWNNKVGKDDLIIHLGDFALGELEIIFSMLGEKVTTEITINKDAQGFIECAVAAKQGGEVAGNARKEAEEKIDRSVVSEENYLDAPETKENLQRFSGPKKSKISAEIKKKKRKKEEIKFIENS